MVTLFGRFMILVCLITGSVDFFDGSFYLPTGILVNQVPEGITFGG
jgi:hypothetical protein